MDDPAPPPSTFAVFKAFWETPPYGREAYDEWPSTALGLARAAYREDPPGFDAFLVEQIRSVGPTAALLIAEVSDAPAVTDALRARLPGAQAAERARIAELLAAKGHREEASDILLELLRGPERRHAAGPLLRYGGADVLDPALDALVAETDESGLRDLRDLVLKLSGFNDTLDRAISGCLWDEARELRVWGAMALRRALADRSAGKPWPMDDIPLSPALGALLAALFQPDAPLAVKGIGELEQDRAALVLILAERRGDPRARPALEALGGELAAVGLRCQ